MSCMCGASASTLLGTMLTASTRLSFSFAAGFLSFLVSSYAAISGTGNNLRLTLGAFLLFEFCVGIYFPSVGVLKSDIVPEHVRGTMYNLYRVPLNGIVVALLLSDISLARCFQLNAFLLLLALLCVS